MTFYRINYNRTTKVVLLESGVSAPGAIGGAYQDLGTFEHEAAIDDDTLPGSKFSDNHVLYHHVQDALYVQEDVQNMDNQTIYVDRVRTIGGTAVLSLAENADAALPTTTFAPANSTQKGLTYESDDLDVATVNDAGLVTGVAAGTANITITSKDNPSVSRVVVVTVT